jgi:hypothetical protein
MAQQDTKTIWIYVLAIALVIVGALYIMELNKPDSVSDFNTELADLRAKVGPACSDMTTEAGRDTCADALKNVQDLLDGSFTEEE